MRGLFPIAFLLCYCGFLFFWGLGDRDLLSSHEARAAQNGQMIVSDGCWGLPQLFDRHIELQKPPMYYWLVALFGHLLGGEVGAWAVRLPAAFSALGCVLFVYYLGKKCHRRGAGFLAALVLASCLHFTWLARVGRIDMPLSLAVTLACGGFFLGMQIKSKSNHWFLLGYVSVAFGILLKGPIAVIFVCGIMAAYALIAKRWPGKEGPRPNLYLLGFSLWWGLPLTILLAAPWFIWANFETNNQIWEVFFCYHNFERGLGGSETLASHPFWFYLPRVLFDLLPWSLAIPAAGWFFFRRVGWREDPLARFGIIWFLLVFGVLSCMSFKRADYLLPAYPGAALFLGCMGERFLQSRRNFINTPLPFQWGRFGIILGCITACYAIGWGVVNCWVVPRQEQDWPYDRLARDIRARTDMPIIFFRAESHVLAFHVGRPLDTILEWENLEVWANQTKPVYFVMPPDCARDWRSHLTKGRLAEVFRTSDHAWGKRERPLVVMRSCPLE